MKKSELRQIIRKEIQKLSEGVNEDENPCWKGYKQIGMKKKDGKEVPNCVPESVVNEDENTIGSLNKMTNTNLERISDYADMIKDRMAQGQQLDAWMYSKISDSVKNLNSVHDTMDGNDGVIESVNEGVEPDIISQLRNIVSKKKNQKLKDPKSGKKMRVDLYSASAVIQVYDALKQQSNKDKFVGMGLVGMVNMTLKLLNEQEIVEYDVETLDELNDFHQFMKEYKVDINEAEYQGRKVKLGKPMQGDVKKFKVYVKNDKGNVVKVNFGAKGMNIKKNNPERRKSFRARHDCDNPGPRWKARYWSCRKWE